MEIPKWYFPDQATDPAEAMEQQIADLQAKADIVAARKRTGLYEPGYLTMLQRYLGSPDSTQEDAVLSSAMHHDRVTQRMLQDGTVPPKDIDHPETPGIITRLHMVGGDVQITANDMEPIKWKE